MTTSSATIDKPKSFPQEQEQIIERDGLDLSVTKNDITSGVTVKEKEWWLDKFSKIWGKQKTLKVYLYFSGKDGNFAICLKKRRDKDGTNSTNSTSDKTAG